MPAPAFRRQPDRRQPEPAAAAAWFAGIAGQAILASEADTLRQAAQDRPGQAGLWLSPSGMGEAEVDLPLLRLRAAARGFQGDVRCGLPLPLPSDSCGVVVVQHLADISAEPAVLLEECTRVLVPGGRLSVFELNPLSPYRGHWQGERVSGREPVTWRRRLKRAGLAPEPVAQGLGPRWRNRIDSELQLGAGARAAYLLAAEKRRMPMTMKRVPALGPAVGDAL